jgi:Ca-activated chloride channel homolog
MTLFSISALSALFPRAAGGASRSAKAPPHGRTVASRTRTAARDVAGFAAASPFMVLIVLAAVLLVAALSAVTLVADQRDPRWRDSQSREPQSRETQPREPQPREPSSQSSQPPEGGRFRFKTAVDLINVSATVTDSSERFVTGLRKEDFILFEDEREQQITHFSDERVPVSLGIVLDTSGSMEGAKFRAAESAIDRFMRDLLSPEDEVFLMAFNDQAELISGWTTDRDRVMRGLRGVYPRGGTAMYDAVAEAIPLAQRGKHRKKAIVVISDGNDTNSATDVRALRSLIRETEVLIYAIGIDGGSTRPAIRTGPTNRPLPIPWPIPGGGGGRRYPPQFPGQPGPGSYPPSYPGGVPQQPSGANEGVNAHALRDLTDDSGGRTELVRDGRDLGPATAGIADELSRQYSLGYSPAAEKDGRWHTIRVEVRNSNYRVRARRGYIATS